MKNLLISEMSTAVHNHCAPNYAKDILIIISLAIVLYYSTILFRKIVKLLDKKP